MTLWDFYCKKCVFIAEVLVRTPDEEVKCPHCGQKMEKKFTQFNFQFK